MDNAHQHITGIILAGGKSQRMGISKAFIPLYGKPLIAHIIDTLGTLASPIYISAGSRNFAYQDYPVIYDQYPDKGPMGGIHAALQVSDTRLNLIVSCDMPLLSTDLLHHLIKTASAHYQDVTLPADENGRYQPLCGVYHSAILPLLTGHILADRLKLISFLNAVHTRIVHIHKNHVLYTPYMFTNANTPDALEQIRKLWPPEQKNKR